MDIECSLGLCLDLLIQPRDRAVRCMRVDGNAEVYLKHRDDLHRYATSLVGSSRAEDVVSTVVLRAMRRRPLSQIENPFAYLMKAVLNEARSVWRRTTHVAIEEMELGQVPYEVVETLDAVLKLPVRQRAAVYLFYWEDRPIVEIAELMGIGPGTVKRYLHNARKRLKEQLR
jgi:RNA polymerase sigma-70 factor (ECF subfamily)